MACHPVYQNLKLEAYLSAPIFVEKVLFGTLNFTSKKIRKQGFSVHERNLIVLMANAIGDFMLLHNKEDHLLELNQNLLALNQKMKRFVGYVAHDLRNPLGNIIGLAQMANKPNTPPERLKKIAQKIASPAETALEFVNTILENAALSTGKLVLKQTTIDAKALLAQACHAVEHLIEKTGTQLTIKLPDCGHILVMGDQQRLQQVLINLLTNAIKYSPAGSTVSLSAKPNNLDAQLITLTITNTFTEQTQEARDIENKVYGSVGFGLDIAKEVIKAHNSKLTISEINGLYTCLFNLQKAAQ